METVLITGGTGLIGSELSKLLLAKNYRVIVASRSPRKGDAGITYVPWNPDEGSIDPVAFSQADHVVHLAGAGIADKRWTKKRKLEILNSRVNGSRTIVRAIQETENKVQSVVSASGIGWYGPDRKKSTPFTEDDPAYNDFLGQTCSSWEESIKPVTQSGKRLVILRTGIVLSNKGGAFVEFARPLKAGVAGILGSGNQVISWIHIADICRAYAAAIENKQFHGIYNAVAPETVTNKNFMMKLARARKRPFLPVHVPEFALKIAVGEMSIEVLKSTTVDGTKLRASGFQFLFPSVDAALNELVEKRT
jgi:uncharacterized protein